MKVLYAVAAAVLAVACAEEQKWDTSSITSLASTIEKGYGEMHKHAMDLEKQWHTEQMKVVKEEEGLRQAYVDLDNEAAALDRDEQNRRANIYNEMRQLQAQHVEQQRTMYDQYTEKDRALDAKYNELDRKWDMFQHQKTNLWTIRHQSAAAFRDQYTQLVYRAGQLGSALTHPGFGMGGGAMGGRGMAGMGGMGD